MSQSVFVCLVWGVWVHCDGNKVLNPIQFLVPSIDQGFCSSVSCFAGAPPICGTWKQRYLVSHRLLRHSATCATPVLHLCHSPLKSVVDQVLTRQWVQIPGAQQAPEYSLIALIHFSCCFRSQTALRVSLLLILEHLFVHKSSLHYSLSCLVCLFITGSRSRNFRKKSKKPLERPYSKSVVLWAESLLFQKGRCIHLSGFLS